MDKSLAEIMRLIEDLDSLKEGDSAIDLLVACGERAVEPLKKYIMEGEPSHIYQPRQRAVIALAKLGAKEVLIEYLCKQKEISDPLFRFGEEAVENTAARALARWQTEEVFAALTQVAKSRTLPGVIEALGSFRRPEMTSLLMEALTDDVSRNAAEHALKAIGHIVKPELIEAALGPDLQEDYESPSILLRRRSAIRILADLPVNVKEWMRLKELLCDSDPEIAVSAAIIALKIADPDDEEAAVETLIEKIPHASWFVQMNIESCLVKNFEIARDKIATVLAQRQAQPEKAQASDHVLRILLNVQRRAASAGRNGDWYSEWK